MSAILRDHVLQPSTNLDITLPEKIGSYSHASIVVDSGNGALIRKMYYTSDIAGGEDCEVDRDEDDCDDCDDCEDREDDEDSEASYSSEEYEGSEGSSVVNESPEEDNEEPSDYSSDTDYVAPTSRMFIADDLLKFNRMVFDFKETPTRIYIPCASLFYDLDCLWWGQEKYRVKSIEYKNNDVVVDAKGLSDRIVNFVFVHGTDDWKQVLIDSVKYTVTDIGPME